MLKVAAVLATIASAGGFQADVKPLSSAQMAQIKREKYWHQGCPVALSNLRVLTMTYHGYRGQARTGQLVVNKNATVPLTKAFRQLYALNFPIHHMAFDDMYGPVSGRPKDGDVTQSFDCRQAVPSPCVGGTGTGTWSNHAYGLAVDVNPEENPYVGCGQSRDPKVRKYFDRSTHRKWMVTTKAIGAFSSAGWGWGGSWTGSTKDYMHFSYNGH